MVHDMKVLLLLAAGALGIVNAAILLQDAKRKRRSTSAYLQERIKKGRFSSDFADLVASPEKFKENFHMDVKTFEGLFALIEPHLQAKTTTRPNDGISSKEKFAAVLEYLASGSLQRHVASVYRISKQHFGVIIDEVCNGISAALYEEIPGLNRNNLKLAAACYESKWNFPNCLGSIDGKHIAIKCPRNAGSLFYNYKGFHSVILMAVADANYRFMFVDIGACGSEGDATVFAQSDLGKLIYEDKFDVPEDRRIAGVKLPFVFVADDAFPLRRNILKPYIPKKGQRLNEKERIFNYRLSRARRCVENAFGILSCRWYCLGRTMLCSPDRAQKIIRSCCYLHNYLISNTRESYCPSSFADRQERDGTIAEGDWRAQIPETSIYNTHVSHKHGRLSTEAKAIRDAFSEYFCTVGAVEWQNRSIFKE